MVIYLYLPGPWMEKINDDDDNNNKNTNNKMSPGYMPA